MKLGMLIASLVLLGTACGVVPGSGESREPARVNAQALSSAGDDAGSDADGTPPLATLGPPLRSNDEPLGSPCGPSRCNLGEYCCNESCGLCAPRGGICLQRECGPAAVPLAQCTDDSGCRMFSSYCDGCLCLPGAVLDPEPTCKATMVACILDPCHHQHPACVEGVCTILDD